MEGGFFMPGSIVGVPYFCAWSGAWSGWGGTLFLLLFYWDSFFTTKMNSWKGEGGTLFLQRGYPVFAEQDSRKQKLARKRTAN